MNNRPLYRNNHYVPKFYLKHWSILPEARQIWTYRTLVEHANVPLWKEYALRGVACRDDLYTRTLPHGETDEMEHWLHRDIEAPAEAVFYKVVNDQSLSPVDWQCLVRFAVAQYLRTPARFVANVDRWRQNLPHELKRIVTEIVHDMHYAQTTDGAREDTRESSFNDYVPFRVTPHIIPESETGFLKVETVLGRGLWLFHLRQFLTNLAPVLYEHQWTILKTPPLQTWFTSDDPVICLNHYRTGRYDFGGGWNNAGSEILMPVGPCHLLYTQVGGAARPYGEILDTLQVDVIQRLIIEHADRFVFAVKPDTCIIRTRSPVVDAVRVRQEQTFWQQWHQEQTQAERRLREL